MTDGYPVCRLGAVASVQGGFAFKSGDFTETGVPVLKIKNVRRREVDTTEPAYVDQTVAKETARYFCKTGDLLISMTGSGPQAPNSVVGRVARFTGPSDRYLINQRVGRFVNKAPSKLDQRYLFYVLARDETLWKLVSVATGSANQANISGSQIESLEVPLPPLAEQKAIAAVLGALDDKIELNRRMNATLEAMARALFKSWFVDFDPVRAKLDGRPPAGLDPSIAAIFPRSFAHIEAKALPHGWRTTPIGDLADINYGKNLPAADLIESGFPVYGAAGRVGFYSTSMFDEPVTLVTSRGSGSGTVHQTYEPAFVTNNSFTVIPRHKWLGRHFLRLSLLNADILTLVTGSAQPQLTIANFSFLRMLEPNKEVAIAFDRFVEALWNKAVNNDRESNTLATLRETLLPKLLTGELAVSDLERSVRQKT